LSYKPLLLLASIIVMILVITMSGCVNNGQTPPITPIPTPTTIPVPSTMTPIPTPTPSPTPTPIPTSTLSPVPVDTIVGLWETYYRSTYGSIEFFENGTLNYTEGPYSLKGIWSKIDDRHYVFNVGKGGDILIILNDKLTWFNINGTELNYVKT
jgi:hypothetical protein